VSAWKLNIDSLGEDDVEFPCYVNHAWGIGLKLPVETSTEVRQINLVEKWVGS